MVVFNQVMEDSTVIRSLDLVVDSMIGKSCLGLALDLHGEVRNLAGEE